MTKQKSQWYGAGKFDPINSTFKSKCYYSSGVMSPGYSKGLYSNEGHDKIVVLEKWILRLANLGYFDNQKINKIEFYTKSFLQNNDELIFTLYPTKYTMANHPKYSLDERLISFLNKLYPALESKKVDILDISHKAIPFQEDKVFHTASKWLKSEVELMTFVLKKHKEGIAEGFLMAFADRYRTKWLSDSH